MKTTGVTDWREVRRRQAWELKRQGWNSRDIAAALSGPMGEVGHIRGITVDNLTIGNLFHAAFRNLADNFSHCAARVFPQRNWQRIVLSGGLTQSVPLLRKMIQARLPGVVKESTEAEETLLGLLEVARSVLHDG